MKHLLGVAFVLAVIILIIIGLTAEDPPVPAPEENSSAQMEDSSGS